MSCFVVTRLPLVTDCRKYWKYQRQSKESVRFDMFYFFKLLWVFSFLTFVSKLSTCINKYDPNIFKLIDKRLIFYTQYILLTLGSP